VFPVHIPTILHGMLVGAAGLLWLWGSDICVSVGFNKLVVSLEHKNRITNNTLHICYVL
jgi:hypothetical protein